MQGWPIASIPALNREALKPVDWPLSLRPESERRRNLLISSPMIKCETRKHHRRYSRNQVDFTQQLADALGALSEPLWLDVDGILPAEPWGPRYDGRSSSLTRSY